VNLINIDMIGPQAPQRSVELFQDSRAAGVANDPFALPFEAHLCGNEHARANVAFGQCLADNFFGTPESVSGSRINDIDAVLDRGPDGGN